MEDKSGSEVVKVVRVIKSRYAPGTKPLSWDARLSAVEEVEVACGAENKIIQIFSTGGQSTPAPGWSLLLNYCQESKDGKAAKWTLFGIGSP